MTSYSQVFGGGTILPGDVSYNTLTTAVDAELVWPREANAGGNVTGAVMDITTTAASINITMASAIGISTGYAVTFYNSGANSYFVKDAGGTTRATVASGDAWILICKDNTTAAGTWLIFQMGAGSASVNAAALAGTGLIASGSLLTLDVPVDTFNTNYTIGTSDRARAKNWTGGSGTLTLIQAGTATNGFFFSVRNTGSGSLSVNRAGSDVINGSATSFTLAVGESTWFLCDGTGWYTFGYGRALSGGSFALLSIDVSGTGDYTLSAGQLNQVGYKLTGTITGARNIIVPTTVAQYWVDNSTTGAFTLTVKTAAGSGVVVPTGSRYILYVDGSGVVDADTGSFSSPLAVADGGTGATTASSARTNLGATSIGNSLFTAATTAAARTAIGSGATGDSIFTAANVAAVYSVIGSGRSISTSGYTTGGGDLSANRTITLGSMGGNGRLLGSGSAGATITDITLSGLSMVGTVLTNSNTGTITGVTAGSGLTGGGSSGSVTLDVGAGTGITVNANDVALTNPMVIATTQNTTSGTTIDFTSIPSGTKLIRVLLRGVSTNGATDLLVQIGTSGGIVSTGYISTCCYCGEPGGSTGATSSTAGFNWLFGNANQIATGIVTIAHMGSNVWISSLSGKLNTTFAVAGGGEVALGGTLDRVRLTSAGGNTFDAGSVTIQYEG